eukprot:12069021-Ditylum_brightwellii.AAC.1
MDVYPKHGQRFKTSILEASHSICDAQMEHHGPNKLSNGYGNNSSYYGLNAMKSVAARMAKASKSTNMKFSLQKLKH